MGLGIDSSYIISEGIKNQVMACEYSSAPIIQEIKSLYDCIYAPNNSNDGGVMDDEDETQTCALVGKAIPKDIWPLLQTNNSEIHLWARLKHDGVMHSMYQAHQGNSQVFFYPDGNKNLAPTYCRICPVHLFSWYQVKHHIPCCAMCYPCGQINDMRWS